MYYIVIFYDVYLKFNYIFFSTITAFKINIQNSTRLRCNNSYRPEGGDKTSWSRQKRSSLSSETNLSGQNKTPFGENRFKLHQKSSG